MARKMLVARFIWVVPLRSLSSFSLNFSTWGRQQLFQGKYLDTSKLLIKHCCFLQGCRSSRQRDSPTNALVQRYDCNYLPRDFSSLPYRCRPLQASDGSTNTEKERMENIHAPWSLEEDQILFRHRHQPPARLASMLGRGLRGVQARLEKMSNENSSVYMRLFADDGKLGVSCNEIHDKLAPVGKVLHRIRWDPRLDPSDFTVLYFDRLDNCVMEANFETVNNSVGSLEELFVFAIPEHRIMAIRYKDRVVWDRNKRIDFTFGTMNGNSETIHDVINSYPLWKKKYDENEALRQTKLAQVSYRVSLILGEPRYTILKTQSSDLQQQTRLSLSPIPDSIIDDYLQTTVALFRDSVTDVESQPASDRSNRLFDALELFSNLVSLLPDDTLREKILLRMEKRFEKFTGPSPKITQSQLVQDALPELNENELIEKFVKGSGAGGQKINKTSNKVILVHEPTQIRVECQDTRSLQQNRKIARKKLQLKLDEFYNGSQSRNYQKYAILAQKKAKASARSKERQKIREEVKRREGSGVIMDGERFEFDRDSN